ncbi:uncharacterized protein LOC128887975 [Hylaeus anthracinus]|uniref:uncharacterized protein LOC128887975 n=1 Tax=Hylaeus anthracinus TaxID=313031 RepID=UPI0023B926D5|nr:uncharacterized protein LOC128887975 [Hylaeus anthracinus]XP_054000494.1 uncharacterized protein LOC128887975 [Hylaeus anthracinus]
MIQSITLELRPRLQICNAFIHLQKEVNSAKVRIKLLEESIEITIENKTVKFLTKFIKLIPNSLSALNVVNDWICFRVQTGSNSIYGSFQTEILINSTAMITSIKFPLENTELLNTSDCNILCTYCKTILSKKIVVKRVLPIPDAKYDPNEWFCCNHNHDNITQNLVPLESDIFYGPLFFVIHASLFNNNLKIDGNTIICNRCLQYLGKVDTNTSLKLWSCSIDYNLLSNSTTKNATDPFTDFLIAIKTSMTGMLGEEIILQSSMGKDIHSLILKPMDWHLNLMIEPKTISHNNTITLQTISIVKVLYKYKTSKSIVDFTNQTYCEVGFLVIKAGLEHLLLSTKRFPQFHRAASDYYIGHIYLEKPANET